MNEEIPSELVPEGPTLLGDICPACNEGVPQEYNRTERSGRPFHRSCAYERDGTIEKVRPASFCPNCRAFSRWRRRGADEGRRLCDCCGMEFHGPTKETVLEETGGKI